MGAAHRRVFADVGDYKIREEYFFIPIDLSILGISISTALGLSQNATI